MEDHGVVAIRAAFTLLLPAIGNQGTDNTSKANAYGDDSFLGFRRPMGTGGSCHQDDATPSGCLFEAAQDVGHYFTPLCSKL